MRINDEVLAKLEKLSMVEVDNKDEIKRDLSNILEFIDILNESDTENVSATFNTLNAKTPLREDIPVKTEVAVSILENAPKAENGYFIVPTIIES